MNCVIKLSAIVGCIPSIRPPPVLSDLRPTKLCIDANVAGLFAGIELGADRVDQKMELPAAPFKQGAETTKLQPDS